jgi:hypothetical protein
VNIWSRVGSLVELAKARTYVQTFCYSENTSEDHLREKEILESSPEGWASAEVEALVTTHLVWAVPLRPAMRDIVGLSMDHDAMDVDVMVVAVAEVYHDAGVRWTLAVRCWRSGEKECSLG